MVEITNLSTYWLNTPESIAARHIEDIARDYFARHDDVSGFLLIVPSIYTFDQIRNDIDIAIFGGFHGLTLQDDYHIDSFAMIVEVKSHPIEYVSVDAGHHYLVTYSDGMKDVTRQALSEALSLKKHLNGSGIECDFVVPAIFFRSIDDESLRALQCQRNENTLCASFKFEQLLDIVATRFLPRDLHDPLKSDSNTRDRLLHAFHLTTAPAILRSKFELLCSESLDPYLNCITPQNCDTAIKGRAGTGKTLLLIKEAINIANDPDNEVLFLTYNHSLLADIKRLTSYFSSGSLTDDNFKTIDSFFQSLMQRHHIISSPIRPDSSSDYEAEYYDALSRLHEKIISDEADSLISPTPTHFIIDEAQDISNIEREIIFSLYPASEMLAAVGIDQPMRKSNIGTWENIHTINIKSCRRMFSNVALFVNEVAAILKCDWHVDCSKAFPGGKVLLLDRYDRDIHDDLLRQQRKHGCDDYDMLLLTGSQHNQYLSDIINNIYDGRITENRKKPPADNQPRLYHYQSCRGIEGWTVVCLGLDAYYEEMMSKNDTVIKMMMPLTRAIDTLVIVLSGKDNHVSQTLLSAAESFPDFVTISRHDSSTKC